MRRFIFIPLMLFIIKPIVFGQCWIGIITKDTNIFESATFDSDVKFRLHKDDYVLVVDDEDDELFCSTYSVFDEDYGYAIRHNIKYIKDFDCDNASEAFDDIQYLLDMSEDRHNSGVKESSSISQPLINQEPKYFLGEVTTNVNVRSTPSTALQPLTKLSKGDLIVFDEKSLSNGFYYVLCVNDDKYGFVSSKYVNTIREIKEEQLELEVKYISDYFNKDPELVIKNDANVSMTLRVNNKVNYPFKAHEQRTITVPAGNVTLMVSSPGTTPYIGTSLAKNGYSYTHTFYLVSKKK